jgi:hypothetical protein
MAQAEQGGGEDRAILIRQYWAAGRRDDLNTTLDWLRTAVALTAPRSPLIAGRLANLGLARRRGPAQDLRPPHAVA